MTTKTVWILRWGPSEPNNIAGVYSERKYATHNAMRLITQFDWRYKTVQIDERPGKFTWTNDFGAIVTVEQTQLDVDIDV